eukprot:1731421-Pleurochrysis_carterae.AAC.1
MVCSRPARAHAAVSSSSGPPKSRRPSRDVASPPAPPGPPAGCVASSPAAPSTGVHAIPSASSALSRGITHGLLPATRSSTASARGASSCGDRVAGRPCTLSVAANSPARPP